jgi:hypothetical protein
MHMQRHHTSHQGHQGQSDATVARRCAHYPIIRPNAPGAGTAELDREQLALGWDRRPSNAQRTSISETTDLNRQIVYVSAQASPTFLNFPSLEPPKKSDPGARTNAAALSLPSLFFPNAVTAPVADLQHLRPRSATSTICAQKVKSKLETQISAINQSHVHGFRRCDAAACIQIPGPAILFRHCA